MDLYDALTGTGWPTAMTVHAGLWALLWVGAALVLVRNRLRGWRALVLIVVPPLLGIGALAIHASATGSREEIIVGAAAEYLATEHDLTVTGDAVFHEDAPDGGYISATVTDSSGELLDVIIDWPALDGALADGTDPFAVTRTAR